MAKTASMALLAAVVLSGCGTMFDTCRMSPYGETCRMYGGVRADAEEAQNCLNRAFGPRPDARVWDVLRAGGLAVDMPFSAVADTLLLPVTMPRAQNKPAPAPAPQVLPALSTYAAPREGQPSNPQAGGDR